MILSPGPAPDETVRIVDEIRRLKREGYDLDEALSLLGIDELAYYRYQAEYGALAPEQLRRLRRLEVENQRLRRAVSELMLDKLALEEQVWSRPAAHAVSP